MFLLASAVLPFDNIYLYKTFVEPRWVGTEKKIKKRDKRISLARKMLNIILKTLMQMQEEKIRSLLDVL